jgi:hypothetical protein
MMVCGGRAVMGLNDATAFRGEGYRGILAEADALAEPVKRPAPVGGKYENHTPLPFLATPELFRLFR